MRSFEEYREHGGVAGLERARSLSQQELIDEVQKAKLRGRGGAGFPTAIKWQTVHDDPCETKYVVCNGSEGEPGTYKDRYLLQKNPYQLVEGVLIAAHAVSAKAIVIGLKAKFTREITRVRAAIADFEKAGLVSPGYIEIFEGPDEYLFGEEKALLECIDGHGALPRNMPPFLMGIRHTPTSHNPTVVNNVESISNLPHILREGADWFLSHGSEDTPGTMIFTLTGDVKYPGMYELPMGTTLRTLIETVGGGPRGNKPVKAVFSGVANRAMTPEQFDTPLDFGSMRKAGSGLGSGGFMVYDEDVCMVRLARAFSNFLAEESCGQCLPCKMGSRIITEHLQNILDGKGSADSINAITKECGKVTNQARCFLPAEESIIISSMLEKFPEEFNAHLGRGCSHPRPELWKIDDFNEQTGKFISNY